MHPVRFLLSAGAPRSTLDLAEGTDSAPQTPYCIRGRKGDLKRGREGGPAKSVKPQARKVASGGPFKTASYVVRVRRVVG